MEAKVKAYDELQSRIQSMEDEEKASWSSSQISKKDSRRMISEANSMHHQIHDKFYTTKFIVADEEDGDIIMSDK